LIKNKLIQKGFSSEEIENIEVQKKWFKYHFLFF
jgi:hypothetical protein